MRICLCVLSTDNVKTRCKHVHGFCIELHQLKYLNWESSHYLLYCSYGIRYLYTAKAAKTFKKPKICTEETDKILD